MAQGGSPAASPGRVALAGARPTEGGRGRFAGVLSALAARSARGPEAAWALEPGASELLRGRHGAEELAARAHATARLERGAAPEDVAAEGDVRQRPALDLDALDPAARQAALLAPPPGAAGAALAPAHEDAAAARRARLSLEELLPALVRRVAWAGDRRSGSVRLELGAGAYAGTTLLVHADAGRVRVEVSGDGADALRPRLEARLRRHGLDVETVT